MKTIFVRFLLPAIGIDVPEPVHATSIESNSAYDPSIATATAAGIHIIHSKYSSIWAATTTNAQVNACLWSHIPINKAHKISHG